jgi:protein-S-isoprenylcysteine O-methyltransferase Ste14
MAAFRNVSANGDIARLRETRKEGSGRAMQSERSGKLAEALGATVLCEPFSTGHRMFWSRILAVIVLVYVVLCRPPAIVTPWILELGELLGMALLTVAAFGRVWCLLFVAGKKRNLLVTHGPYSIVRNPLYVFSFLGAVGFGLAVENPLLAIGLAVVFGGYYHFVVKREERFLAAKFGEAFEEYVARTPRWLPRFSLYTEPPTVTVAPLRIDMAILDATWFLWAFFLWELLELYRGGGA